MDKQRSEEGVCSVTSKFKQNARKCQHYIIFVEDVYNFLHQLGEQIVLACLVPMLTLTYLFKLCSSLFFFP